jgi:hypothetical protein
VLADLGGLMAQARFRDLVTGVQQVGRA